MYNYIKGKVAEVTTNAIVLEANGIGYDINATCDCLCNVKVGDTATIYTYLHVKEDSHTLYGFTNQAERALFLQLLNVNGVGAKSAITMLSTGCEALLVAIAKEDILAISAIKGVSRKTAEKVILELRGKLPSATSSEVDDAISGLVNLGLSRAEALSIIKSLDAKAGTSAEQIISMALKARRT